MIGLIRQFLHFTQPAYGAVLQILQTEEDVKLTERAEFDFWPALINMIAVLALVVGLIVLLGWLLRRFGGARFGGTPGSESLMKIVSTLSLGDKRSLAVIKVGQRYFLIGIAGEGLSNLSELEPEEVEKAMENQNVATEEGGFAAIFRRFSRGKGEGA